MPARQGPMAVTCLKLQPLRAPVAQMAALECRLLDPILSNNCQVHWPTECKAQGAAVHQFPAETNHPANRIHAAHGDRLSTYLFCCLQCAKRDGKTAADLPPADSSVDHQTHCRSFSPTEFCLAPLAETLPTLPGHLSQEFVFASSNQVTGGGNPQTGQAVPGGMESGEMRVDALQAESCRPYCSSSDMQPTQPPHLRADPCRVPECHLPQQRIVSGFCWCTAGGLIRLGVLTVQL